jgi:multidrug resistance efflux pump
VAALLSLFLCFAAAPAVAGSCAADIAAFRQTVERQERLNPESVGTAKQTIAAQLEHQPTPMSVARGRHAARAEIAAAIARAENLDSQGRADECRAALDTAQILLDP